MASEIVAALDNLVAKGIVEKELVPDVMYFISDIQNKHPGTIEAQNALEKLRTFIPDEIVRNCDLSSQDVLVLRVAILIARFSRTRISFSD